jgi:hypothetical protein
VVMPLEVPADRLHQPEVHGLPALAPAPI